MTCLKGILNGLRERTQSTTSADAARAFEACGQLVQKKIDMGARIDALSAAQKAPKSASSEVHSLQVRSNLKRRNCSK